jgi:hypothetical protein
LRLLRCSIDQDGSMVMSMMRCTRCICGIKTEDGLWCVKFKGLANDEIAKDCQDFVDRSCFGEFED